MIDLHALRDQLDQLDARLIADLAERQAMVRRIADAKRGDSNSLRDVPREEALLARVVEHARAAGLDTYFATRLFREILEHSLRHQEHLIGQSSGGAPERGRIRVAFQGTAGAYSHLAAQRHFSGRDIEIECEGFDSFGEMLEAVRNDAADSAILPIENTTAGTINDAYDLLARMDLAVVGEEVVRVDHCLLALDDVPVSQIRRVYSHIQALTQCSNFLRALHDCHVEAYTDTAMAAEKVRDDQDLSQAAIASEEAAALYGLKVIRRDITNRKDNFTRFLVVAKAPISFDIRIPCKTSIIFATRDEEGALLGCLNIFHMHQLNLTKLESRPRPNTPWEYLFYVDFEGNVANPDVHRALQELSGRTAYQKVLGSYPTRTGRERAPAEPRAPRSAAPQATAAPAASTPEPSILQALEKKPYRLVSRITRAADSEIRVGHVTVGGPRPVIIAGPCSVESRDQIMAAARAVKESGGDMLRGGCFKPRTSPYDFQGLGFEGLDLLVEAGRAYGLPIVTEVLHPADVEKMAAKADVLQLGARNMQNYALLKEVGKVDRPIMLKRGLMASIDEWLAAAEYILAQGNQQVILCERGIRTFETATRNTLDLTAIPVVRERTHLPVIVDPSHACGVRRWVPAMSAAALASGAQGLIVEIHPDPAQALSDGPQALTFDMFAEMMKRVGR